MARCSPRLSRIALDRQAGLHALELVTSKSLLIASLLLASCSPIRGCMESQFTLEADSRLPKWFAVPATYTRDAITVQLSYYVPPFPVDNTVIEFLDRNGKSLSTITGQHCWHPVMEQKKN